MSLCGGRVRPSHADPTSAQAQVGALIARGPSNGEISERQVLSLATVKTHIYRTLAKLGLSSRAQLVAVAYEEGLVRPASPASRRPTP